MAYPGLAVVLMIGVGVGALLYYVFAGSEESGHGRRHHHVDPNQTQRMSNERINVWQGRCCRICLEDVDRSTGVQVQTCRHVYHQECIEKWRSTGEVMSRNCPICRRLMSGFEKLL